MDGASTGRMINVLHEGLDATGSVLNTQRLQILIEDLGDAGGGTLVFPPGTYLTGGLKLCSHLKIQLDQGAVLLGSPDLSDYTLHAPSPVPFPEGYEGVRALLFALDCEDLVIEGSGTIDGQGALFDAFPDVRGGRPRNIWFARCENVRIQGVRLRNSGFWMQHYLNCTNLHLSGLDIWNHGGTNNDGIDIDGCRDVTIENCVVDSSDDAICLKSGNTTPTVNVVVRDCRTSSHCNHFKTGTESRGGFHNIRVSGLTMVPSAVRESHAATEGADWRGACGIALAAVDGGSLSEIHISDISMDKVRVPFFIRLGDRGLCAPGVAPSQELPTATSIRISNVRSVDAGPMGGHIVGLPGSPVRDVVIEQCAFHYEHSKLPGDTEPWDLREGTAYPSCDAFGWFPAYGFFLRYASEVRFSGITFSPGNSENRPALRWDQADDIQTHHVEVSSKAALPANSLHPKDSDVSALASSFNQTPDSVLSAK